MIFLDILIEKKLNPNYIKNLFLRDFDGAIYKNVL